MPKPRQLPLFPDQPQKVEDLHAGTSLRHTLALFQQHLAREGKTEYTITAFTSDLQLLAEHSGENTPIGQFTTTGLNEFLDWLEHGRGVPCSRKSYARRVTTLKVYFKWLHTVDAIPHDPARATLQRSGPAPLATILSPGDVRSALDYAASLNRSEKPDVRPLLLLRLLLDTGIKKGETAALKLDHIDRSDPHNPLLLVRHRVHNVYKDRRIALPADWLLLLDEYLTQYKPKDTVFTCTPRNLEYILEAISSGAELPTKMSFEMLRWTCAVRDYRAGMEPELIRDKLGLSDASWHETFAKIKRLTELQMAGEARATE
ncbi:MAG: tyrosine-type recombinase/integrase [Aggregatilineales bacterium]